MTALRIRKYGENIYLGGDPYSIEQARKILVNVKIDHRTGRYCIPASLATFTDLKVHFPESLVYDHLGADAESHGWVIKMYTVLKRQIDLQKGLKDGDGKRVVELPQVMDYVWEPFPHQKEAIAFALNLNRSAMWLDMGLGKTYTAITVAKLRHAVLKLGPVNKVLVVAPRSLLYQWKHEINTLARDAKCLIAHGLKADAAIREAMGSEYVFVLTTYESMGTLKEGLTAVGFDMFILDEATKIKNPKAKRTNSTVDVCNDIPYGLSLTGMPYVNNPLDIYSQFLIIDTSVFGSNQWVFSQKYINYGTAPFGRFIKGYKNMDKLKDRAYLYAFSRTKRQCLDLPEKVFQVRKLPLNELQYTWYNELLGQIDTVADARFMESDDAPAVTVEYVIALVEKLQQITSGFIYTDDGQYINLGSQKYDEMWSIISDSDDVFMVWARHTYVIRELEAFLLRHKVTVETLTRRSSDSARQSIKERFRMGKIKVLILQIQSECRGNDFTCETHSVSAIFFENTASVEERSQAEDRQHRIGMTGTAVYVDLVCEDTYDEGIQKLLASKRTLSEYIREQSFKMLLGRGGTVYRETTKVKKKPKGYRSPEEAQKIAQEKEMPAVKIEGLEF